MSPKDVVVGKPRDEDDHVDWLLERESFAEALDFAEAKARLLRRHNVLKVVTRNPCCLITLVIKRSTAEH